jgi:mRNA-degrading endonuclease toxin of MazEF toxin-antitoxin module
VTFRRWDIVAVPFPFIEGYAVKRRPALVVSSDVFHRAHRTCFGAMNTTARHMQDRRPDDIEIADLGTAGLRHPCVIRVARLATFE